MDDMNPQADDQAATGGMPPADDTSAPASDNQAATGGMPPAEETPAETPAPAGEAPEKFPGIPCFRGKRDIH